MKYLKSLIQANNLSPKPWCSSLDSCSQSVFTELTTPSQRNSIYSCEDWALIYTNEGIHNKTDKIPLTSKQTRKENSFSVQQLNLLSVNLLILIHSETFTSSRCAFSRRVWRLFDDIVTCVSSVYMPALENFRHFSKSLGQIMNRVDRGKCLELSHKLQIFRMIFSPLLLYNIVFCFPDRR